MGHNERATKIEHTDVLVIGNGPNGITLSYFLSGWWPFYNPVPSPHPNTALHNKLTDNIQTSLVEQDLEYLSAGLEGRSQNPIALLFDTLTHPDADLGYEKKSRLRWERCKSGREIPHLVLGSGSVGGCWHNIDGNILTLSLGSWMELPNLSFKDWLDAKKNNNTSGSRVRLHVDRATAADVAQYYVDYVEQMEIGEHFRNGYQVTSVHRVDHSNYISPASDKDSGEREINESCANTQCDLVWEVNGYIADSNLPFCIHAKHLVLAVGSYDIPNKLKVPGENLPFVHHSISELEYLLLPTVQPQPESRLIIIGAGLSAADAIVAATEHGIPVTHIFRRSRKDPHLVINTLPRAVYPEYHQVREMMAGRHACCNITPSSTSAFDDGTSTAESDGCELYKVEEETSVECILPTQQIVVRTRTHTNVLPPCRAILVLVGSRPDIHFMSGEGRSLASDTNMPVSKNNLIEVDVCTYESTKQPNIYAMGPLVGDNFVRFGRGAALAISNHIHKLYKKKGTIWK